MVAGRPFYPAIEITITFLGVDSSGEGGIRTRVKVAPETDFESAAFDLSATSPAYQNNELHPGRAGFRRLDVCSRRRRQPAGTGLRMSFEEGIQQRLFVFRARAGGRPFTPVGGAGP